MSYRLCEFLKKTKKSYININLDSEIMKIYCTNYITMELEVLFTSGLKFTFIKDSNLLTVDLLNLI